MRDVATLLEALPYIREFHGSTVVIKYGGAAMDDPLLREEFARDVVLLKYVGMSPVVVHGGGPDITAYMKRLDMPVEFVGGLRVSDEATVEIAKMVLVGKLNTDIVLRIGRHGQPAVGLSATTAAAALLAADGAGRGGHRLRRPDRPRRPGSDQPHRARLHPRGGLGGADARATPTTSTPTRPQRRSPSHWARARRSSSPTCAAGCEIRRPRHPDRAGDVEEVRAALAAIEGGMRPKLQACVDAVRGGVGAAQIIDGRVAHSLLLELFTDAGIGTKVVG